MKDVRVLSVPGVRVVCGYEVRKMPIGRYLEAIEEFAAFPGELVDACFPDMEFREIVERLTAFDDELLGECIVAAFGSAPKHIVGFAARLTGIPHERLMNDPQIGLDGFAEIVNAFIEVNNLGKFVSGIKQAKSKIAWRAAKPRQRSASGCKDLSQPALESE